MESNNCTQQEFVARDELLRRADFVVLPVPLTGETFRMINRSTLRLMEDEAYLINVARGPVVATEDLLEAMRSGRLAGAGLDVTDPEPLPLDHGLRQAAKRPDLAAQCWSHV